jgi:rhamnulokinase
MKKTRVYLAIDLGAGSGRVLAGLFDGEKLELREMNRFPSEAVRREDGWHWNFPSLLEHIKTGIRLALEDYGDRVVSLGVDTWGVDYGLIDAEGNLKDFPFQYRDSRTEGRMEEAFARMPKEEIYRRTGIQFLYFNTLYQLLAETFSGKEKTLLFMPDLVNYFLTGRKANERSIASTGQLLDAKTQNWDSALLTAMGLPEKLFGELVDAGTDLGGLLPELTDGWGIKSSLRVIAVGSHDTASAVAGVPALEEEPVFLSSGTWSLMGRELKEPVLTEESFQAGFSNEGGVLGTTRFLKNISGMWLLQECKRCWDSQGTVMGFDQLVDQARSVTVCPARIDPDAKEFQAPENMSLAIADYCRKTGQTVPETPGEFTRLILESLAVKYAEVKESLEKVTGKPVTKIYIVGGGSQNRFLNQLAADATGCEIVAGPVEATSLGNILIQMVSAGEIMSLREGRSLVAKSFPVQRYLSSKKMIE